MTAGNAGAEMWALRGACLPEPLSPPHTVVSGASAPLPFLLPQVASDGAACAAATGKVFDGADPAFPAHMKTEGQLTKYRWDEA